LKWTHTLKVGSFEMFQVFETNMQRVNLVQSKSVFIPLESFQIVNTQSELAFPFGAKNYGQKKA